MCVCVREREREREGESMGAIISSLQTSVKSLGIEGMNFNHGVAEV